VDVASAHDGVIGDVSLDDGAVAYACAFADGCSQVDGNPLADESACADVDLSG